MEAGMSLVLTSTPVVGLPALTGWAQVVHNHSGHLVCAYAISGQQAHNLGRDLADVISSSELPDAVSLHQLILDLLARTRKAGSTLQFAAVLQSGDHLVVAAYQGQVLYRREGATRPLIQAETEPKLLEGKLIPNVTLVAFTQQAETYSELVTQQLTQGWDIDTIVTSLLPTLHDQTNSALSALAFVAIDGTDLDSGSPINRPVVVDEGDPAQPTQPIQSIDHSLAASRRTAFAPVSSSETTRIPAPTLGTVLVRVGQWLRAGAQISWRIIKPTSIAAIQFSQKLGQKSWTGLQTSSHNFIRTWNQASLKEKQRAIAISVAAVVILGLVISGVVWQFRVQHQRTVQVMTELKPAQTLLADAQATLDQDPVAARDKTNQAISQLTELSKKYAQPAYLNKPIAQTLGQAQQFAQKISGQSQLQELPVFFDLRLTEPNFLANRVVISDTTAYFADTERKQIIKLDLSKKQSTVLPLGELDKLTDFTLSDHYLYLLGGGLKRWDTQSSQPVQTLKPEGDSDRDSSLMNSFGQFLYVLNPTKRNLFRFAIDKQGKVSDPVGWLTNKKDVDFTQLTSLAVDGDIWLTSKTGQVFKFTQGQPATWQFSGVKTLPDSPIYLVTSDALSKIYVLEPNRRRLLVLDKTGQFLKELSSATLASATSFGVSESLGKAFVVSGSIVYEIAL